jgi:hypothetical protein
MRKLKDVLRLQLNSDQSHQQIATALGIELPPSPIQINN